LNSASELPELAHDKNLIETILRDMAALGLVGEQDAALLVYLSYVSRKLNNPSSIIVRGPSGSGKDKIQRTPALLMPEEDVIEFNSLTANALYYNAPGWLKNKILLGGERSHRDDDAQKDKTAAVRQMLSQGYITKITVNENRETEIIRQDGPVSYSETTTQDSIFREDANRCFQINTDPGEALTRKVMLSVAGEYLDDENSLEAEKNDRESIIGHHQEFQQSLEYVDVRIPFARKLAEKMPAGKVEIRRAISHVLAVIESIAFLHQHQRAKNDNGKLIATQEDYRLARRLLLKPLIESIGCGNRADTAHKILKKKFSRGEFTSTQTLKEKCFNNKVTRDKALKQLAELGVLKCVIKGTGRTPSRWKWTGKTLDLVLPDEKTLFRKFVKKGKK
jgi:hypothetical protein